MRSRRTPICTYIVSIDGSATNAELQTLAAYLSTIGLAACEVIVVDASDPAVFAERHRILRWVGRHVARSGDLLQTAVDVASTDKIIVAAPESRYTAAEIAAVALLLDRYEAVEPAEFIDPLPWWGAVDAGRILLHRGLDQERNGGATFAFRRSAFKPLRGLEPGHPDPLERLSLLGADVQSTRELFVRTEPPKEVSAWARLRAKEASTPATVSLVAALFACILPLLAILAVLGGIEIAGAYAGVVAFASVLIALRGRMGAARFFPLRACFFAPLAIVERSLAVYWSLFARVRVPAAAADDVGAAHAPTLSSVHKHPAGDSHVR